MKKLLACVISLIITFSGLVGCAEKGILRDGEIIKSGSELRYYCSDQTLSDFLNDFYSRHIRNGEDAIGLVKMGNGETYQKLWETDSIVWFDSSINGLGTYDAMENIRTWITNITQDNLSDAQKLYAATDAWACVRLYKEMMRMQEEGYCLTPTLSEEREKL